MPQSEMVTGRQCIHTLDSSAAYLQKAEKHRYGLAISHPFVQSQCLVEDKVVLSPSCTES